MKGVMWEVYACEGSDVGGVHVRRVMWEVCACEGSDVGGVCM